MQTKKIVKYDEKQDTLLISKGKATYASIDIDDFILDFDKRGFLVGIEIEDASRNFNIGKDILKTIESVTINATYKPNLVKILIFLKSKNNEKEILIPVSAELGHRKVTTEKFAVAST
ncbi:DUF2283 domain-containing protein [Candidatus Woesearchaeota archaeon]|nr:DUF2283 domain-containing protein [Candidatus Woesearchaeota archaeon]